jgi:hypothetical protein
MLNNKKRLYVLYALQVGIILLSNICFGSVFASVRIEYKKNGNAKIDGDSASYYYYSARIMSDMPTSLLLKQGNCIVTDNKGNKYSKCWIGMVGGSQGVSFMSVAPLIMKPLNIIYEGKSTSEAVRLGATMIEGPEGKVDFMIPKGGYVDLTFLWAVPKQFMPVSVNIANNAGNFLNK